MRKFFLLIPVLFLAVMANATTPTITIDGDKSDWAEVPMLTEPGTWPMLKVLPAADAELGTNALVYMMEHTEDFDPTWEKYPTEFIDKDYDKSTAAIDEYWGFTAMGVDYKATTGVNPGSWISFPKAMSANNKVFEIGFPATYITDLGEKFGFAMFYNSGAWFCPDRSTPAVNSFDPENGFLYKTRSYATVAGTTNLTTANVYAHPSMGEVGEYVDFGLRDNGYDTLRWAAFPINLTQPAAYDVTVNISSTNDWKFEFWLVDVASNVVVAHLDRKGGSSSDVSKKLGTLDLTAVPAGKYMLKVQNKTAFSKVKLNSIDLTYAGGTVQNISSSVNTTLNVADALFTAGFTRADGQVSPGSWKPEGQPLGYVKWNIATSETKFYNLTLNFSSTNAHSMAVNIYEDEEASPVATVSESYTSTTGTLTISDRVNLVGGKNYVVKVTNPTSGSQAKVTNIVFAPVVAVATELPNTLAFSNAVLSEKAHITDGMLYFNEIGDKDPVGQWAQWDVTTDHDGLFLFTMNVTSENEQSYKITIKDNSDNVLDFYETSPGSGNREIKHYFALGTGTYFVKVENTRSYSKGHLVSFAVSEPDNVVTIDEAATDNTLWVGNIVAKEVAGPLYDVQIIRTIKAGMYNTFCLPFEVSSSQCKDIFGSDVQIRTLEEATVEEGDFVLNLNFKTASDIYPGTPVLIQTSRDIVNPVFTGVKFTIATPSATTKTNANYTGTFVKTALEANENILFLGANNKLYFPTATVDMYGMRGWFVIHGSGGASAPKFNGARIVMDDQIATDIELVNSQKPTADSHKLLIDGQLFIIRDGVLHNVTGARVK